jgi:putative flippase GtrA
LTVHLRRQIRSFFGVGFVAAAAHYGVLVALVEFGIASPVPATLVGYIAGGSVSYLLNRRHTFRSERPHLEATWRFAAVAGIGFLLTAVLMNVLVVRLEVPYLPAQVLTTGAVLVWSFVAHRLWTFRGPPLP